MITGRGCTILQLAGGTALICWVNNPEDGLLTNILTTILFDLQIRMEWCRKMIIRSMSRLDTFGLIASYLCIGDRHDREHRGFDSYRGSQAYKRRGWKTAAPGNRTYCVLYDMVKSVSKKDSIVTLIFPEFFH